MITLDLAFVVQIINFMVLLFVLNVALYKPVRAMLAQRRQEVESARERALSVDQQVGDKVAAYEARLKEAKESVALKRSELMKEAQAEEAALVEKARSEAAASLVSLRQKIARETSDARNLLQAQADMLSGDICRKILGRSL